MATTLKIPEDLKRRVRAAAKAAAISPHAFMLRALEAQTLLDEQRREFLGAAVAALEESATSGKGYRAADVHRYLLERTRGKRAARPAPVAWRK
jgi:predicted transcriptional regulator